MFAIRQCDFMEILRCWSRLIPCPNICIFVLGEGRWHNSHLCKGRTRGSDQSCSGSCSSFHDSGIWFEQMIANVLVIFGSYLFGLLASVVAVYGVLVFV